MTQARHEELLQRRLDGALDAVEASELAVALEHDQAARERAANLDRLTGLLEELGDETASPDAVQRVMARIAPPVVVFAGRRTAQGTWGGTMARKIMWGLAAAAIVVLGVFALTGFPHVDDAQGTIGAAKRYNAGQLADTDVQLGDTSAQEFLQSDTFAAIMKDPDAVRLLSDPGLSRMLADPALARALGDPDLSKALRDPGLARFMVDANFAKLQAAFVAADLGRALNDPAFQRLLASLNGDLSKAVADPGFAKLGFSADLAKALSDPGLARFLSDPGLAKAFSDPAMSKALTNPALGKALADPGLSRVLLSGDLGKALSNPNFAQALATARLSAALRDPSFGAAFAKLSGGLTAR